jgi:hypothetical protein
MNRDKRIFLATCVDIVDDVFGMFKDATELAQMIENSGKVPARQFLGSCEILPAHKKIKNKSYAYNPDYDIYWFYDKKKDIHYFYG